MTDLKPCPFCGGTAEMCNITVVTMLLNRKIPKNCVGCFSCEAWVMHRNLDDAITIWNTRVKE